MTGAAESLFDATPLPMWVFDRETLAFLRVNDATCALYGWTREEMLALTLRDIRPPEELARLERTIQESTGRPDRITRQSLHRTREGRILDVELDLQRIDYAGRPAWLAIARDVTGVREAERLAQLIVSHSGDGLVVIDVGGIVRYMSPGAERMLGLAPGALVGKHATLPAHPDDAVTAVPPPGQSSTYITRARHADGSWRWLETRTTNLTLDVAVRGYVCNVRDVTEREESRRRLEFLMTATSAVTYSATPQDFRATFISANVRELLGYSAEELIASNQLWIANIHPDDRQALVTSQHLLFADGARRFEYRFRRPDGSYRWILDACRVVRDPGGEPRELVGYMVDITDAKRAEDALRRSEVRFRALIERLPLIVMLHRGGRWIYANPFAIAKLGYDRVEDLVGRRVLDVVYPDDHGLARERLERTAAGFVNEPVECRVFRRDGAVLVFEVHGMILDLDDSIAYAVFAADVTERREMLARMVVADRMLSVGTLAAGVAHEINNPLSFVIANIELLAREVPAILAGRSSRFDADELQSLIGDARDGATRVSAIVRDLRSLARSDEETRGSVDVVAVLRSSIKMAHNELRHRARLVEQYADALPAIEGNASRLGQVFLNLLVNAAQAIPEGRAEANEVRVRVVASGGEVLVDIEDTGAGIPRDVIGRIFDPFFTTKPIGVGIGLGLSISHQIVQSMGGAIDVASSPGRGTRFRVTLPAVTATDAPDAAAGAPALAANAGRVLMIDDEPAVGRSTRMLLAPEYDIVPLTRGAEALAWLERGETFDAILCDVMMPEMTGIEFFQQLCARSPEQARRVVFLTGGAFTQQAREFLADVAQPHVEKPFREEDLRRAIELVRATTSSAGPAAAG